jgi:hypothetical protein
MSDNVLGSVGTARGLSLALAVIHHGLSCFAHDSIPAKTSTVIVTAQTFERYILGSGSQISGTTISGSQ